MQNTADQTWDAVHNNLHVLYIKLEFGATHNYENNITIILNGWNQFSTAQKERLIGLYEDARTHTHLYILCCPALMDQIRLFKEDKKAMTDKGFREYRDYINWLKESEEAFGWIRQYDS